MVGWVAWFEEKWHRLPEYEAPPLCCFFTFIESIVCRSRPPATRFLESPLREVRRSDSGDQDWFRAHNAPRSMKTGGDLRPQSDTQYIYLKLLLPAHCRPTRFWLHKPSIDRLCRRHLSLSAWISYICPVWEGGYSRDSSKVRRLTKSIHSNCNDKEVWRIRGRKFLFGFNS